MTNAQAVWIADSTPLIVLAKIGNLDLMTAFATILVPQTVVDEVLSGDETDPARQALEAGWGIRVADETVSPALAALSLDPGEEAALAVALARPGSYAVLDDKSARRAAKELGVSMIGTFGIVARAKSEGHIAEAKPIFTALMAVGFRADPALIQAVLAGLGEIWP